MVNCACLHSLRGCPEEARRWLERAEQQGYLEAVDLEDCDLEPLRTYPWFADMKARLLRN